MSRIWIIQWAYDYRNGGVVALDVPTELLPDEENRHFRLSREYLQPWHGKDIFFSRDIHNWYRSEAAAKVALKRQIERDIRAAKRDLETAKKRFAEFKANGLPMASTIAEKKAARLAKRGVTPGTMVGR